MKQLPLISLLCMVTFTVTAMAPPSVAAEERLVVGIATGEENIVNEAELQLLEEALEEESLIPVPRDVAQVRFLRHVSKPAPAFDRHELDNLPQLTDSALRNLARGRYGVAKKELSEAMELGDRGLLTIAREERRAKEIFDVCLYLVRAHWEVGRHEQARDQAIRCRRLFPDLLPTSHQKHTPEVRTLMREADERLSHGPRGALRVTSSPAGCVMRLGGIQMGTTPVVVEDLASQTYRVQVECGPEGRRNIARVYSVPVNEQTAELHVDVSLDKALAAPKGDAGAHISLRYDSAGQAQRHLPAHAKTILEGLRYDELWLLGEFQGVLVVSRATESGLISEPIGAAGEAQPVSKYIRAVRALANAEVSSAKAANAKVANAQANAQVERSVDVAVENSGDGEGWSAQTLTGAGLLGAGTITLGVSWALHIDRASSGDGWAELTSPEHPEYLRRQQAWLDKRWTSWLVGGAGALSTSLGAGLLASRLEGPKWWTWALGGVGFAVAGWGAVEMAGGAICDPAVGTFPDVCVEDEQQVSRGLLLTATGLPLVSFALSAALFSGANDSRVRAASTTQLSLELSRSRAMLHIGGSL